MARNPKCIGIIMDGNRRWARAKGLPTFEGHRQGLEKIKECVEWAKKQGIANIILFALSTENWNRSEAELSYLMGLFKLVLTKEVLVMRKAGIRVRCIGERERFSAELQILMREAEEKTAENNILTLGLC